MKLFLFGAFLIYVLHDVIHAIVVHSRRKWVYKFLIEKRDRRRAFRRSWFERNGIYPTPFRDFGNYYRPNYEYSGIFSFLNPKAKEFDE